MATETYEATIWIVAIEIREATIQTEATVSTETQEATTQIETIETQEPAVQEEAAESLKLVKDEDNQEMEK